MTSLRYFFRIAVLSLTLLAAAVTRAAAQHRVNYDEWELEWAEEFNQFTDTVALSTHWQFAYPWGRTLNNFGETEYYTSRGVRPDTAEGVLNLVADRLPKPRPYGKKQLRFNSGMLLSAHNPDKLRPTNCGGGDGEFSYGLFEVRCRQPRDMSSFPAFWLWGGVPDEIDVFEANREAMTNTFHVGWGGWWRPSRTGPYGCSCFYHNTDPAADLHTEFHTYGVEWLPNEVYIYYDGVPIRHETRLVPEGCGMHVIVNLAMLEWIAANHDTLAVDYIRIYRPKVLPPSVAVLRRGGQGPETELVWLPFEQKPGRLDPAARQGWAATSRHPHRLDLALVDNRNPPCDQEFPLPLNGHWAPAWVVVDNLPIAVVRFDRPDSVAWHLADGLGRAVATGTLAPDLAQPWQPRWPAELPPGAYTLHLRQGPARASHPVMLFGRSPYDTAPIANWWVHVIPAHSEK